MVRRGIGICIFGCLQDSTIRFLLVSGKKVKWKSVGNPGIVSVGG